MKKGKRESSKASESKENKIAIESKVKREDNEQDGHIDSSRDKDCGCTGKTDRD